MEWHGVEIEIQVPCAEGQTHPVRLRCTGWGKFEVVYNPCEELLGEVFARMARCTHYLREEFPEAFRKDTDLKRRLVKALRAAGAPAVPALIEALGDSDAGVRESAGWALRRAGDLRAVPALIRALGDENGRVRRAAAEALAKIGTPAMPALLPALKDSEWRVRRAAAWALGAIGDPQAVPALIKALRDNRGWGSEDVRRAAAEALVKIGAPAMPALIQALGDSEWWVRGAAAEALGKLGDPQAVPALIQALGDKDEDVRGAAAEALGKLGDPQAVPALIQALGDRGLYVRRVAAEALGKLGDPHAVPALIKALRDSSDWVREGAAEALGAIGDPQAVPALIKALGDDWGSVRRAAAEALGKLGDPQAVPALSVWAHAGEDAARNALQAIGHPALDLPQAVAQLAAQGAWGVLIRALPNEKVRKAVVRLGAPAVPALIQALRDNRDWRSRDVRRAAAEALGELGDPQAVPHLIQALGDWNEYVRRAAAEALGKLGDPQAVPALIHASMHWDPGVRAAICWALGELGDPQAIPRLKKMLKSRYGVVSAAAQRAIEQINAQRGCGSQP